MNSNKKNTYVGVMLLGIFALGFTLHAEAHAYETPKTVDPFCTGEDVTPRMQAVCTNLVGGAKTWEEAAMFSLRRVSRRANQKVPSLLAIIETKLAPTIDTFQKSQIIDMCKTNYQFAIEKLERCQTLITDGPFAEYGSTLTSIYTSFYECHRAIVREPGQPDIFEVTNFTNHIEKLIDVALIISKKDPRKEDYDVKLGKGQFKDSAGDPSLIGSITQAFYGAHID